MPIYEYQCKACCYCFEELMLSSSDPAPKCPKCACADVEKLMSASCIRAQAVSGGADISTASNCRPSG